MMSDLSPIERLFITPKREHVSVTTVNIIDCPVCKVGNLIIEGEKCGICEKLKLNAKSEVAA